MYCSHIFLPKTKNKNKIQILYELFLKLKLSTIFEKKKNTNSLKHLSSLSGRKVCNDIFLW